MCSIPYGTRADNAINAATFDLTSPAFFNNAGPVSGNANANTISSAASGLEVFFGGDNNDTFVVQSGATLDSDTFNGGNGVDTLDFSAGAALSSFVRVQLDTSNIVNISLGDQVFLSSIENYIGSAGGSEEIRGDFVGNILTGGSGDNKILGRAGNDTIDGGDGDDTLQGDAGFDTIVGGNGNDTIIFTASSDYDNVAGGNGIDTLDASLGSTAINFNMNTNTLNAGGFVFAITGIEKVVGTQLDDIIHNSDIADANYSINAGNGNDTVFVGAGNNMIDGGLGVDTINTSNVSADYILNLNTGATNFGNHVLIGFENAVTGNGNDVVTGTNDGNELETPGRR